MLAYALFQDWGNYPRRYAQATDADRPDLGGQLPGHLPTPAAPFYPVSRKQGPDPRSFTREARRFGIPVLTPKTLRTEEAAAQFRAHNADAAVVGAYGLIPPGPFSEAVPRGGFNSTPSLPPVRPTPSTI